MQQTDFSNVTFHCHSLGKLMTDPKGKSNMERYIETKEKLKNGIIKYTDIKNKETITAQKLYDNLQKWEKELAERELVKDEPRFSDTCKSELIAIYTELTSGRVRDVKNKYVEKGLLMEQDAITAYSKYTETFFRKNTQRKYNNWIEGELDIEEEIRVTDTKASWDIFSFDKVRVKPILPLYHWQQDGYMWLFNKPKARVAYCLLNTPKHLVEAEKRKLMYEMFGTNENYDLAPKEEREIYLEACNIIEHNHNYDDLPLSRKVVLFDLERSEERIERIKTRIPECRWFLNNIDKLKIEEDDTDTEEEEMVA